MSSGIFRNPKTGKYYKRKTPKPSRKSAYLSDLRQKFKRGSKWKLHRTNFTDYRKKWVWEVIAVMNNGLIQLKDLRKRKYDIILAKPRTLKRYGK